MAKHRDAETGTAGAPAHDGTEGHRVAKLERRLAKARAVEAKRARKLERARRRGAPHAVKAARRRKLRKARARGDAIERKLAHAQVSALADVPVASVDVSAEPTDAQAPAGVFPEPVTEAEGRRAYCLRERKTILMVEPRQTVMRNGRPALTGSCPSCGARVTRPIRATSG